VVGGTVVAATVVVVTTVVVEISEVVVLSFPTIVIDPAPRVVVV